MLQGKFVNSVVHENHKGYLVQYFSEGTRLGGTASVALP